MDEPEDMKVSAATQALETASDRLDQVATLVLGYRTKLLDGGIDAHVADHMAAEMQQYALRFLVLIAESDRASESPLVQFIKVLNEGKKSQS